MIQITKQQIKELYLNGSTITQIAEIAKCNPSNIHTHLKRMEIKIRGFSEYRKYSINKDFFKVIDTEEKAYILGFLYADGYNQVTKKQVRLTLQRRDEDVLKKINKALKHTKPLYILKDNTVIDLSINSKDISLDLEKLGCVQNKTFKITFPFEYMSEDLYRHFIRGYFDGDGCVSINKHNNYNDVQMNITGNEIFINQLQDLLISKLNINKTKLQKRFNSFSMFYHGRNVCFKILDYLYKDNKISLNRKNKLYKKIVSWQ